MRSVAVDFNRSAAWREEVSARFTALWRDAVEAKSQWHALSDSLTKAATAVTNCAIEAMFDADSSAVLRANERGARRVLRARLARDKERHLKRCLGLFGELDAVWVRLRTALTAAAGMAREPATQWVQLSSGVGQLHDFGAVADELLGAYEREHDVKRRVLRDLAVCESLETLNVYMSALLMEVFATQAARRLEPLVESILTITA